MSNLTDFFLICWIFASTVIGWKLVPAGNTRRFGNFMMATTEEIDTRVLQEKIKALMAENEALKAISSQQPLEPTGVISPPWFEDLKQIGTLVRVKEWDDRTSRPVDGFQGYDFCHDVEASVRIVDYIIIPANEQIVHPSLVGLVHFTPKAESHRGLCHGGTMCALMDDVIGWLGFCIEGYVRPWTGFTVQVDTSLKKPVAVGSLLRLEAKVDRREGARKVWIVSRLVDDATGAIHAEGKGLFLLSPDAVATASAPLPPTMAGSTP